MRRAFTALRSGTPGPVVLEMPLDVLSSEAPDEVLHYEPVGQAARPPPTRRTLNAPPTFWSTPITRY